MQGKLEFVKNPKNPLLLNGRIDFPIGLLLKAAGINLNENSDLDSNDFQNSTYRYYGAVGK